MLGVWQACAVASGLVESVRLSMGELVADLVELVNLRLNFATGAQVPLKDRFRAIALLGLISGCNQHASALQVIELLNLLDSRRNDDSFRYVHHSLAV